MQEITKLGKYLLYGMLFVSISFPVISFAQTVTIDEAREYAYNLFIDHQKRTKSEKTIEKETAFTLDGTVCYYIFEFQDGGYAIIAGDKKVSPVLGYSLIGGFPEQDEMPDGMSFLLDWYAKQISEALQEELTPEWNSFLHDQQTVMQLSAPINIPPLMGNISWDQSSANMVDGRHINNVYNKFCPAISTGPSGRAVAGCTAIAMAQIMRYWEWPYYAHISDTIDWEGNPSIEKHWVEYEWTLMPDSIRQCCTSTREVDMIAGLLRDCGYMAHMKYTDTASRAGGAAARDAFVNIFDYNSNAEYKRKTWYITDRTWTNKVISELVDKRPVLYIGYNSISEEGHAFVVDGYSSSTGLFHINWGWGGSYNGNFTLDNLRPSTDYFNENFYAIFGLEPNYTCTPLIRFGGVAYGDSVVASTGGAIATANVLESGATGLFYSGDRIHLTSGFHAKAGSYMHATICEMPCARETLNISRIAHLNDIDLSKYEYSLTIAPVAATDMITIRGFANYYYIFNAMGQLMEASSEPQLNVSSWPAGMYIVVSGMQSGKFFKK